MHPIAPMDYTVRILPSDPKTETGLRICVFNKGGKLVGVPARNVPPKDAPALQAAIVAAFNYGLREAIEVVQHDINRLWPHVEKEKT